MYGRKRSYAAVVLVELPEPDDELEPEPAVEEDDDEEEPEEEEDEDDAEDESEDDFDAGELLDEEPRLSLR